MDAKKPAQKYSSLLGPVDDEASPRPKATKQPPPKETQRYESLLPPVGASDSSAPPPRYSSIVGPDEGLFAPTAAHDEPLPYVAAVGAPAAAANRIADDNISDDDLLPPDTFVLANTEIYGTRSPYSPPLYKLSLSIGHLRDSNMTVAFKRLDYRGRDGAAKPYRERHIYDLKRLPHITAPKYQYHLEALTRRTLGHVGLLAHRGLGSSGWRAWNISRAGEAADFVQGDQLFDVKVRRSGHSEWLLAGQGGGDDGDRKRLVLAYETAEGGIFRLQVVEAVDRRTRDALVATWCLKLWWEIAASNKTPMSWDEVKRILQTRTGEFPIGTGAGL